MGEGEEGGGRGREKERREGRGGEGKRKEGVGEKSCKPDRFCDQERLPVDCNQMHRAMLLHSIVVVSFPGHTYGLGMRPL